MLRCDGIDDYQTFNQDIPEKPHILVTALSLSFSLMSGTFLSIIEQRREMASHNLLATQEAAELLRLSKTNLEKRSFKLCERGAPFTLDPSDDSEETCRILFDTILEAFPHSARHPAVKHFLKVSGLRPRKRRKA